MPEAVRSRAGGLSTGTLDFELTIADLNEPQTVEAPKNARPLSELTQLIAGGATGDTSTGSGSSSGTGSSAGSGTGSTGSGTADSSSQYLDCISKAGSDVAEIQKCATLVGQ